jgi:hypothetical protein
LIFVRNERHGSTPDPDHAAGGGEQMCHERWASRRDELVETSWLRDLRTTRPERPSKPRPRMLADLPVTEESVADRDDEAVVAGGR